DPPPRASGRADHPSGDGEAVELASRFSTQQSCGTLTRGQRPRQNKGETTMSTAIARFAAGAALATALGFGATASAQDCEPSEWGADDEIGAANHVDAEQVKMAAGLVTEGKTHPLGIVIDPNMPAFPPRGMMLQIVQPTQHFGRDNTGDFGWKMAYND